MHEYSLVTELVEECQRRAGQRRVRSVTVRCPATVDRLELKTLFVAVSTEHHMAGVRFEILVVSDVRSVSNAIVSVVVGGGIRQDW